MAKVKGTTVSDQLVSGTIALVEAGGVLDLSVRRLAEASERSTMCVYTYFHGRANLIAAAHQAATGQLLSAIDSAAEPATGLQRFAAQRPQLLLWLFTAADVDVLTELREQLVHAVLGRLAAAGDRDARRSLARAVGESVLGPLLSGSESSSG